MTEVSLEIELHEKQGMALESVATEILYGGAAGGGKSFLMRAAAVMWCGMIPGLQVYLFRRLRDDLVKNHIEGPKGLRSLLAPWVLNGLAQIVEDEIRFWNGSRIYLCHCKDPKDRFKYLGAEIHVLLIDELTTFPEVVYRFLRGRCRMAGITLPPEFAGMFPRIICGSNPGNIGHAWVKAAFIDGAEPFRITRQSDDEGGMLRQFIPARLGDNPTMALDDPFYGAKLSGLGSPELVRAMKEGDWSVVAGAYFPEFVSSRHVVTPRTLPGYWLRFRSFDWGSAKPFSVGWWAISDGELPEFPRGALIRYREWYGAAKDGNGRTRPNVGLRLVAEQVADGIKERERGDLERETAAQRAKVMSGVADPSIFAEDGGPSIASRMADRNVFWRPADNTRVGRNGAMGGWDQVRARLIGEEEKPALYVFSTCLDFIRTFPALQHDEDRIEDLQSDGEDHVADECFVAGTLIETFHGPVPIERVQVGDRVATRDGWRKVLAAFSVGERPTIEVRYNGGRLVGTANHPVWTEGTGFVPLASLRRGDILRQCKWLSSATRSRNSLASAIIDAAPTFGIVGNSSTERFGPGITAAFRAGLTSIIATTTRLIIRPAISFAQRLPIISPITVFCGQARTLFSSNMRARVLLHGMALPPAVNGTQNTTPGTVSRRSIAKCIAYADTADFRSWVYRGQSSAQTPANQRSAARRVLIWSIDRAAAVVWRFGLTNTKPALTARFRAPPVVHAAEDAGAATVYNLTVEDAEEYFANGVLVHNCRYACLSRPYVRPLPADADLPEPDRYARKWKPARRARGSAYAA